MIVIMMGVAGTGKTTVGQRLAEELGWSFADADDFHSPENRAKMAAGQPLTDADRAPWLQRLREQIETWITQGTNAVLACSALKESYRQILVGEKPDVRLVYLYGDPALILERLSTRSQHYMGPGMLASQLATLEPPQNALAVEVNATPTELVAQIRRQLGL